MNAVSAKATSSKSSTPLATNPTVRTVAVIDIGTTSIRMAIAEISPKGTVRNLERLSQPASLGKDTFIRGAISKSTIEDCVRILQSYRHVLEEYRVTGADQIRVVATSAVREAINRLAFLDRIYIATGLQIEPLDEAEVNRLTYLGILPLLQAEPTLASSNTLVVEVGGGTTEVLAMRQANVTFSHTYRLGSLRLRETLAAYQTPTGKQRRIMETQIQKTVESIREQLHVDGPIELIAMGGDVRFAAAQILSSAPQNTLLRLPLAELEKFTDAMLELTDDAIISRFHLSGPDAETLGPALLTYVLLARVFQLDQILVPPTSLRDGLVTEMAVPDAWTEEFSSQIIRSAVDLGLRYSFDEAHARHVAELASSLFEQLQDEHRLEPRYLTLLYLAALLHEIGLYVSQRSYHKHSLYLILHSELFGIGHRDQLLLALVARYHRRAAPKPEHEGYVTLDRDARVVVSKLAAILRVAIALDDSRSQRVHEISCRRENGRLIINVPELDDLSLEQLALRQNSSLFEETFGCSVFIRATRSVRSS
ncbi:MAG: exopolyphosphatase [Planctomycetota bacterium]